MKCTQTSYSNKQGLLYFYVCSLSGDLKQGIFLVVFTDVSWRGWDFELWYQFFTGNEKTEYTMNYTDIRMDLLPSRGGAIKTIKRSDLFAHEQFFPAEWTFIS